MRPIKLSKKERGLAVLAFLLALGALPTTAEPVIFVPTVILSFLCCFYLAYHHEGGRIWKTMFMLVVAVILALISYWNLWSLRARLVVSVTGMQSSGENTNGCTIYLVNVSPAILPPLPWFRQTSNGNKTHQMSNTFPSDVTKGNELVVGAANESADHGTFLQLDHLNVKIQFPDDIASFKAGMYNDYPGGGGMVEAEIGRNTDGECYPKQTTAVDDPNIVVTKSGPAMLQVNSSSAIPPGKIIALFIVPYLNRHSFSPPSDLSVEGSYDYTYHGITRRKAVEFENKGMSKGVK